MLVLDRQHRSGRESRLVEGEAQLDSRAGRGGGLGPPQTFDAPVRAGPGGVAWRPGMRTAEAPAVAALLGRGGAVVGAASLPVSEHVVGACEVADAS